MPGKRTIRIRKHEHYKIADFTFVEMECEVSETEVSLENFGATRAEIKSVVDEFMKQERKDFKRAFAKGDFDLT